MQIRLTEEQQTQLEDKAKGSRQVRHWRRFQAVLLLARGQPPKQVAALLGCSQASVYNWAAAWHSAQDQGLQEGQHPGRNQQLDAKACALLDRLLSLANPQQEGYAASNWTVPLLQTQLRKLGYQVSQRTLRRTLHRLGWRWKRPKYVLGRPDAAYAQKKLLFKSEPGK